MKTSNYKNVFFLLIFFLTPFLLLQVVVNELRDESCETAFDTIESFYECNFYISRGNGTRTLFFGENSKVIVNEMGRYLIEEDHIYVVGKHMYSSGLTESDNPRFFAYDPESTTRIVYPNELAVPQYLKINLETAEMETYLQKSEIPESEHKYYFDDLSDICNWKEICFEFDD